MGGELNRVSLLYNFPYTDSNCSLICCGQSDSAALPVRELGLRGRVQVSVEFEASEDYY